MAAITAMFWDVGGVILSNGWDRPTRQLACKRFDIDWDDFQDRHELLISKFETGRLTLDQYLQRTVFYRARPFSFQEFKDYILSQSTPNPETLSLLEQISGSGRYLLGTINNESRELNEFRIQKFGLAKYFTLFLTSCYIGLRKPDEAIYRRALELTQRTPGECLFIDDRSLNVEIAAQVGLHAVCFKDAAQLRAELERYGVELPQSSGAGSVGARS
jgi:putative hydrolase of the HAD superfamily